MQIEIRLALRLHKVNDGSHIACRKSRAGEVGSSGIAAIGLESPGREVLLSHHRGLTDDPLQRRHLRALRQRAFPVISDCHFRDERNRCRVSAPTGKFISSWSFASRVYQHPPPGPGTATWRVPAQSGRRVRKGRRGVGGGCGDALVVEDEAEN